MTTLMRDGEPIFEIDDELADAIWAEAIGTAIVETGSDPEQPDSEEWVRSNRETVAAVMYIAREAIGYGWTLERAMFVARMGSDAEVTDEMWDRLFPACWAWLEGEGSK